MVLLLILLGGMTLLSLVKYEIEFQKFENQISELDFGTPPRLRYVQGSQTK